MLVIGQLVSVVPLKALYLICVIFFEGGSALCGGVRAFIVHFWRQAQFVSGTEHQRPHCWAGYRWYRILWVCSTPAMGADMLIWYPESPSATLRQ